MRRISCIIGLLFIFAYLSPRAAAATWPIDPEEPQHQISAVYGLWVINPGDPPFMHSGIDIAVPPGTPIYAIESGWVKVIMTPSGESMWRIVIGDHDTEDTCDAWMYAHVISNSILSTVGDWVEEGDYIGDVVDWSMSSTVEHLHLSRIRYHGDAATWIAGYDDWEFIDNPLDLLPPDDDTITPVLQPALDDSLLAFCRNQSGDYFAPGEAVSGDVDIIAKAYDYYNWTGWKNVPYSLEYKIDGDSSIDWTMAACFGDAFGTYDDMAEYTYVVYQDDATCNTERSGSDIAEFYFNLTNTDNDTLCEESDKLMCWSTTAFHNGEYTVFVRAADKSGNAAVDSMTVTVANAFELSGTVTAVKPGTDLFLTSVETHPDNRITLCDELGGYLFPACGGGAQDIVVKKLGFEQFDTTVAMTENRVLNMTLTPCAYINGDANSDQQVNVGDAVYLINYAFKSGPEPIPQNAGDANGDRAVNVGDAVYVISFVFKGGPEPAADCRP